MPLTRSQILELTEAVFGKLDKRVKEDIEREIKQYRDGRNSHEIYHVSVEQQYKLTEQFDISIFTVRSEIESALYYRDRKERRR